jgi:two-component system, OmpR family, sensor kinase
MTAGSATIAMPLRARRGLPHSIDALPLRVRLVAVVLVLLLTALTLTGLTTIFLMRRSLMTAVDRDLAQAAVPTASQALDQLRSNRPGTLPTSYAVRFMPANGDAVIFGPPSTAERRQHPDIPRLSIDDPRVRTHKPFTVGSTGDGGGRWRVIAGATDADIATYAVAVSLDNVDTSVRDMRKWAILIDAAVMVACAITAWYGVRRAFRPLTQIEDTAAAIAAGDLTRRIPERTAQDEVSSLSTSLNVMLAQIEQSFAVREASEERMRQFVADASHELRTPLAAVRGYAELFRQGAVSTP